jgi:hypothetical protein
MKSVALCMIAFLTQPSRCEHAFATAPNAVDADPICTQDKLEKTMTLMSVKNTLEKTIQMISSETGVPMTILVEDLQLEGITKNQNISIVERDKTGDHILRTALQKAGPEGKLVYVVSREKGIETILITTRAAARKRGDILPPGF